MIEVVRDVAGRAVGDVVGGFVVQEVVPDGRRFAVDVPRAWGKVELSSGITVQRQNAD